MTTQATTIGGTGTRLRPSLEELVDRLMAAVFRAEPETAPQAETPSVARSVHEARRLRQAGDLDGALAVFAGVDTARAETREARWAYAEWTDLVRRRFGDRDALVYSQGAGRAAALVPKDDGSLGGRGGPGDALGAGQGRLAAQPAGSAAPERGCVMVVANASVDIPALKARHPLGDTVEASGVRLRGRGRVRQGVCPFHDEVEGSFTVYADSERWYCFGCGLGGDVLDFVRRVENLSLPEAIQRLDGGAWVAPGAAVRSQAAARFYAGQLRRSPAAREYLASRGVALDAAARLGLGYAPGSGLREALASDGFNAGRLRDCGLFTERGERFAGMVVVPDASGGLVRWLVGRAIDPDRTPRFQALPGSKPVLGLGRLGPAPPFAVVAEGVFDWLALAQWGVPAVAALGTQGVEKVAEGLRGCPRVFLAFDSDDAGLEATERLAGLLGRRAAAVTLPQGVGDVAELAALPHGRAVFLRLLAQAARSAR